MLETNNKKIPSLVKFTEEKILEEDFVKNEDFLQNLKEGSEKMRCFLRQWLVDSLPQYVLLYKEEALIVWSYPIIVPELLDSLQKKLLVTEIK